MKVSTLLFLLISLSSLAQYNLGNNTFSGFEQTNSSKSLGVGSRYYALPNGDLSTTLDQAALLDVKMQGSMHSTIGILPSGVNFGVFSTALKTKIGCKFCHTAGHYESQCFTKEKVERKQRAEEKRLQNAQKDVFQTAAF